MFNLFFLNFLEAYLVYFIIFFYFNHLLVKTLKFVIQYSIGSDLWTYFDDSIRLCPNNTFYDSCSNLYILDYEYFEISDTVYYHHNFLDIELEKKYYFDFYPEFKNREEEDHELYGLMSTYIIPLQYKYYILEHYWPEDDKVSVAWPNFYDFEDLNFEFKFIYEDYKVLWPHYKKFTNTRELFYNDKLYENNFLQSYFYNALSYIKLPFSHLLMLENKKFFWKKESRTFDLIEPSYELSIKKYMTWFLLKCKYDEAKFEYDVFCNLPPYDVFDPNFYDVYLSPYYNLLDFKTKRHHFIENTDDYFFDFINSDNLINYYFSMNLLEEYQRVRLNSCDPMYDKPRDPFDYLFFLFHERLLLMITYLFIYYYYCWFFFYVFVCYFCWFHHVYAFDFDLYNIEVLRMLTRNKYFTDYNDYNWLIFNYTKLDINYHFYFENKKLDFERYCTRDRIKFPRHRTIYFE